MNNNIKQDNRQQGENPAGWCCLVIGYVCKKIAVFSSWKLQTSDVRHVMTSTYLLWKLLFYLYLDRYHISSESTRSLGSLTAHSL